MIQELELDCEIRFSFIGPPLSSGPLPALFYFAVSAADSLSLDPFSQPALYFKELPVRVFSVDLPFHGKGQQATDALKGWAHQFELGLDPLTPFAKRVALGIEELQKKGLVNPEQVALMGLSRGGLISCLVALHLTHVAAIVGFAPLTNLLFASEFSSLSTDPRVLEIKLERHAAALCHIPSRYYIGNRDTRVDTASCFSLVMALAKEAEERKIRSLPHELIISPSIGHKGHGTGKEVFHDGAAYLAKKLRIL